MPTLLAVGAVVFKDDTVLLVERGHAPQAGTWSLPGGKVLPGEPLDDAIVREVAEETALRVTAVRRVEIVVLAAEGRSYEIHEFLCAVVGGEDAHAGDDARAVRWCTDEELDPLGVSSDVRRVIALAREGAHIPYVPP